MESHLFEKKLVRIYIKFMKYFVAITHREQETLREKTKRNIFDLFVIPKYFTNSIVHYYVFLSKQKTFHPLRYPSCLIFQLQNPSLLPTTALTWVADVRLGHNQFWWGRAYNGVWRIVVPLSVEIMFAIINWKKKNFTSLYSTRH